MTRPSRNPFARRSGDTEPRLELSSWVWSLIAIVGVAAVIWIVQIVNASQDYAFDRFGLEPRVIGGLWGILTEPFLHASYDHIESNTLPLIAIGWVLLLSGLRIWAIVTAWVVLVGGALTWMAGPSHTEIVGASGMVFGWMGYLLGRAIFTRRITWILAAVLVLSFFGSLLFGALPSQRTDIAWQAHLFGLIAGIAIAFLLHPRTRRRGRDARTARRPAVS